MNTETKIVAIPIHGYNVSNPEKTINKFRPYFEAQGVLVETFSYGYLPFTWQITRRNPKLAERLDKRIKHWQELDYKVILVNHSNGAAISYLTSMLHNKPVWRVLSMHPALVKDLHPYVGAERIIVVHNQGDRAVVVGKMLARFVKFVTPNKWQARPWGEMGQDGYTGESPVVINIDTGEDITKNYNCSGHSEEFSKEKAPYWLHRLTHMILEE